MYRQEDYEQHETISFVIQSQDRYLMLYHNKYNLWTIPIGKFNIQNELPSQALYREAKEELDIDILNYIALDCRDIIYSTDIGSMSSRMYLFKVLKYKYYPTNNEPEKHKYMKWMTIDEILLLDNVSESTRAFLEVLI